MDDKARIRKLRRRVRALEADLAMYEHAFGPLPSPIYGKEIVQPVWTADGAVEERLVFGKTPVPISGSDKVWMFGSTPVRISGFDKALREHYVENIRADLDGERPLNGVWMLGAGGGGGSGRR